MQRKLNKALMIYQTTGKAISTDPSGLEGDTTTWEYDLATGLELKKTYADGRGTVKTYDAYNNLSTVTDARGVVASYSYNLSRGLLTGIDFSDDTPAQKFTYNFLGQLTAVQDASGARSISYGRYGSQLEEVQQIASSRFLLQEQRDTYGRGTGYILKRNGNRQCAASITYGTLGRIALAGFIHAGVEHQFRYGYLAGSNLLQSLAMPNGVTLTQSYEEKRDLLTGMDYVRDNSLITQREYNYDALGRPTTRDTRYPGKAVHHADAFTYNERSQSARRLAGRLDKSAAFAPKGRGVDGAGPSQPIQWSSEMYDVELGLVYYNYRYYNPTNGRWTRRDLLPEVRVCNLYEFTLNAPIFQNDILGLVSYSLQGCTLHVTIKWKLNFKPKNAWNESQMKEWEFQAKELVESYYNAPRMFRCVSTDKKCCMCRHGINAKVEIDMVKYGADFEVEVQYISGTSSVTGGPQGYGSAKFDREDLEPVERQGKNKNETIEQTPIIHETGHMLGVPHPGQRLPEGQRPVRNSREDYRIDPYSLMGLGMELRLVDYNDMFCKKIPQKENCTNWEATDVEYPDYNHMA